MPSLRYLHLSFNSLTTVDALFEARNSRLEHVDVSNNKLKSISPNIRFLEKLTYLGLENNDLNMLPPEMALCSSLQHITCTGNPLRRLKYSLIRQGSSAILTYLKGRIPADMLKQHESETKSVETPVEECEQRPADSSRDPPPSDVAPRVSKPSDPTHTGTQAANSERSKLEAREPNRMRETVQAVQPAALRAQSVREEGQPPEKAQSQPGAQARPQPSSASSPEADRSELMRLAARVKELEDQLKRDEFSLTVAMKSKLKRQLMVARSQRNREEKRLAELAS